MLCTAEIQVAKALATNNTLAVPRKAPLTKSGCADGMFAKNP